MEVLEFQTLFNVGIALAFFILGWIVKRTFHTLDRLSSDDKDMREEITKIMIGLPTSYVTKNDLTEMSSVLFKKLDAIDRKLDTKQDKVA